MLHVLEINMKSAVGKLLSLAVIAAILFTSTAWAKGDPFVGDWKLNPARSKLTDVMKIESLGANKYLFNFGGGPQTIVVDGTDQPANLGSTLSVAAEKPDTWKVIRKRDGRVLISAVWNLSEDGSTLTDHYTGFDANGSPHTLDYVYKRKAEGSGFAGEWVSTSETVNSVVTLQIKPYDDGLSFIEPSISLTRNLKFDGKDYPNSGPNATPGVTSAMRRVNEHALEIAQKINGNLLSTQTIELSSDLNTLTITRHIVGESEPNIRVFERD